jgi:hypothetical protein
MDEKLEAAAYLFEKSHGNRLTPGEISAIEKAGLAAASPNAVADDIWRALGTSKPNDYRASAYWALGKLARKADKPRFVAALRVELQQDGRVAYQIMIALANLGEPVFSRKSVRCDEDEVNRQDALSYLDAQG